MNPAPPVTRMRMCLRLMLPGLSTAGDVAGLADALGAGSETETFARLALVPAAAPSLSLEAAASASAGLRLRFDEEFGAAAEMAGGEAEGETAPAADASAAAEEELVFGGMVRWESTVDGNTQSRRPTMAQRLSSLTGLSQPSHTDPCPTRSLL